MGPKVANAENYVKKMQEIYKTAEEWAKAELQNYYYMVTRDEIKPNSKHETYLIALNRCKTWCDVESIVKAFN